MPGEPDGRPRRPIAAAGRRRAGVPSAVARDGRLSDSSRRPSSSVVAAGPERRAASRRRGSRPTGRAWPGSACRWPTPWSTPTSRGSCTATSSRRTCCWTRAGTVWVTDFGLAKADDQQNLTHTGDILGTLRYMPPEAFEGKADARGDVYALGLTLYELLALRPAFDEKDRNRLIKQVTTEEPPRLGRLNPRGPARPGDDRPQGDRPRPGPPLPDGRRAGGRPAAVPRRRADPGPADDARRAARSAGRGTTRGSRAWRRP